MDLEKILKEVNSKFDFRKTVEINGIKFELGLLSLDEEQKTSAISVEDTNVMSYYVETQKLLISFAIKKINDEEIPEIVKVEENEQTITKEKSIYLREFIARLPTRVIDQLYDVYVDLKEESESNIEKEMKYKWFKTPEEREKERKEKEVEEAKKREEDENNKEIKLRKIEEPPEEEGKTSGTQ